MKPELRYYRLGDAVTAFTTTRKGGVSRGEYGEFNINSYCGDDPEAIVRNRESLASELGLENRNILMPHQVHGVRCLVAGNGFMSLSEGERKERLEGTDALTTDIPGVCVGVSTADCIPVLLYDESHNAVAAIHAGWRGTVQRIAGVAVETMRRAYDTDPRLLKAVIGPGITLRNFEVGQEVYDKFSEAGFDMNLIARKYNKWHIDLPECNRRQLLELGLSEDNITLSGIDTFDDAGYSFSARRQGQASGRLYSGIFVRT